MDGYLELIWWLIFLGFTFKVINMISFIFSINAEKEIKLRKDVRDWSLSITSILGVIIGIDISIHGLTLITYALSVIIAYLIFFIMADYFNNKLLYSLGVMLPVSAFLGHWTGVLAAEISSPYNLELIVISIPFILPYIQYKLIFNEEKLVEYLNDYQKYIKTQPFQTEEIHIFTKELDKFSKLHEEFLSTNLELKNLERELDLKIIHKPKKTKIFNNRNYYEIKNRFLLENKVTSVFSEFISVLGGGIHIAGSDEESIIKAIGHFNYYLHHTDKKHFIKLRYMEFTKGKCGILNKIVKNYYLLFYLKYVSDSKDASHYFSKLKKYILELHSAWNERYQYTPSTHSQKEAVNKLLTKLNDMEKGIKADKHNRKKK